MRTWDLTRAAPSMAPVQGPESGFDTDGSHCERGGSSDRRLARLTLPLSETCSECGECDFFVFEVMHRNVEGRKLLLPKKTGAFWKLEDR